MPIPQVKGRERSRTKKGRWFKKRSDVGTKQVDLFGNVLPERTTKGVLYPWTDVCCKACFFARRDKCTCRCGGAHHGEGRRIPPSTTLNEEFEGELTVEQSRPFWGQIEKWEKCTCGASLVGEPILYQKKPHAGGWKVKGMLHTVWLYIRCPKCSYDWNLSKLGVTQNGA